MQGYLTKEKLDNSLLT